jgi:hypothetical protein
VVKNPSRLLHCINEYTAVNYVYLYFARSTVNISNLDKFRSCSDNKFYSLSGSKGHGKIIYRCWGSTSLDLGCT